jgi:hypothetical protein
VVESAVDLGGDVTFEITVENDTENTDNILTTTGLTAVRDILLNQTPATPAEYVFGTGDDAPQESDTSLTNEEYRASLARLEIQQADTSTEWQNITSLQSDEPLYIESGQLKLAQTAFFFEAEDNFNLSGDVSDTNASAGQAESHIAGSGFSASTSFAVDYTIPGENVGVGLRYRPVSDPDSDGDFEGPGFTISVNGNTIESRPAGGYFSDAYDWDTFEGIGSVNDLDPGSHTITYSGSGTDNGGTFYIDAIVVYDTRENPSFDNSVDSDGYLSSPALYPQSEDTRLDNATSQVNSKEVFVTTSWNDVSNNQEIRVGKKGDVNPVVQTNTQTFTNTFTDFASAWFVEFQLSRYGSRDTASPTSGFKGQSIDSHAFEIDPDQIQPDAIGKTTSRAIVDNPVQGVVLTESGQVTDSDTLLTHSVFAEVELDSTINNLISAETIIFQPTN